MTSILDPRPMTPDEIADLVRRARPAEIAGPQPRPLVLAKDTARGRFSVGDRVRRTAKLPHRHSRVRTGVVVGFGKKTYAVRVRIDGNQTSASWHMDCWAPTGEAGDLIPPPPRTPKPPRLSAIATTTTKAEKATIEHAAKSAGLTVAQWLRMIALERAGDERILALLAAAVRCSDAFAVDDHPDQDLAHEALDVAAFGFAESLSERDRLALRRMSMRRRRADRERPGR